jgi:DNA repair protein RecO (recombination protein O)
MGARSRAKQSHETLALVLRRTPYGDADLIVTLFTSALGQVSAIARSARKSQRRFGGNLEPLHTLEVEVEQAAGSELLRLCEARIVIARLHLLEDLTAMEAAGKFLSWIRHSSPEHTPEPQLWELSQSCLDELDSAAQHRRSGDASAASAPPSATLTLASHGLRLLVACGWRLELEYCVQSGVRCPDGKAAMIDPERGGLIARAHGGASLAVDGATRQRLIATQAGRALALEEADASLALELVERCLRAHAGLAR